MKVRVLGCSGSEGVGSNPPGLLVNDVMMLDAGTITGALNIEEQSRITDVLLSHAHLDHAKSLPFLADNVITTIDNSINVRAIPEVLEALRKHLFNNVIWPDFTRIPLVKDAAKTVLACAPIAPGEEMRIAGLDVKAIPMKHPVPAAGFLVKSDTSAFLYSGDTGPNETLWKEAAGAKNLSAIIVDTSFPNSLDAIANISGHFTPAQLHRDLNEAGIEFQTPIYIFHIKPAYREKVQSELQALGRKNVKILEEGKMYHF